MSSPKRRFALLGLFGGAATGLGGLGAFGVCHTVCTATIAALAAIGITGIVMPFTFLQNPWFIAASLAVGIASLVAMVVAWVAMRRRHAYPVTSQHRMSRIPLIVSSAAAVLLLLVNEVLILDVRAAASGTPSPVARLLAARRIAGFRSSGNLADDAVSLILRTGIPERYGPELGVSFPNPADQQAMNAMMALMAKFDPGYGSEKIVLDVARRERYVNVASRISCEFCCGAKAIVFPNGEAACGCAHSQAMRGLAAYLLQNHADEYTDDEILRELARWKGLYFPKQMVQKLTSQVQSGQYTPDIAALLFGIPEPQLKAMGAQAASLPKALEQLPQMSGGC